MLGITTTRQILELSSPSQSSDAEAAPKFIYGSLRKRLDSKLAEEKKSSYQLFYEKKKLALKSLVTSVPFIAFLVTSIWLFSGIVFYSFNSEMTFYNSFFYTISAGMNIGFADLSEANNDRVHAFTACFILIGSATAQGFIGYCLGYFLANNNNLVDPEIHSFDNPERLLQSHASNKNESDQSRSFLIQRLWYQFKHMCGWYSHRLVIKTLILFVVWMSLGVAYGMAYEGWTFITALYFAITSASTAGLQSPACQDPATFGTTQCDLGITRAALAGVFSMIGVPGDSILFPL